MVFSLTDFSAMEMFPDFIRIKVCLDSEQLLYRSAIHSAHTDIISWEKVSMHALTKINLKIIRGRFQINNCGLSFHFYHLCQRAC